MESLIRYTLISIGVLILVFIFWISLRRRKQHTFLNQEEAPPFNQVFFDEDNEQDEPIEEDFEESDVLEDNPEEWTNEDAQKELVEEDHPKSPDEFAQISIFAKPGKVFGGYDLLQTLTANHFHFGDMHIFHYHRDMNPSAKKLFSLVSAQPPGDFNLDKIGLFKTKGLVLFMNKADHVEHADYVYELMQEVAYQLAEDLGGEVKI